MVYWLSMHTHNVGVMSSNPACVTIKAPLTGKTSQRKPPHKSTFLEKLRALVSAKLEIEYATQFSNT